VSCAAASPPPWLAVGQKVWLHETWFDVIDIDTDGRVVLSAHRGHALRGLTPAEVAIAVRAQVLRPVNSPKHQINR